MKLALLRVLSSTFNNINSASKDRALESSFSVKFIISVKIVLGITFTAMETEFIFPWQYNFPPFFTIQPNQETQEKQLEAWRQMILDYFRVKRLWAQSVADMYSLPLFINAKIDRKLSYEGVMLVLESLQKQGLLEWADKKKERFYVYWKTPADWASLIYNWATDHGFSNTVCTVFELINGADTVNEEFYGLEKEVLIKALQILEKEGKAVIMGDNEGVKFA